ncbi:MAG TPA: globin family protein, partial [Anaerolineales bacterium]|nr:globin family protein [Anaerolineales bacterium]
MSITLEQKRLVQETWEKVVPIAETAAELFYGRLFEIDPELKPLFKNADMKEQKMKLLQMLGMAVKGLDNLDQLVPAVENLGRRHVGYGVKDSHYDTVGDALLWTLEKGLGEDFTPEVMEAWTETYVTLATVMKNA